MLKACGAHIKPEMAGPKVKSQDADGHGYLFLGCLGTMDTANYPDGGGAPLGSWAGTAADTLMIATIIHKF